MNLLQKINNAIHTAATTVTTAWNDHIEPWMNNFLKSVLHDEISKIVPIAEGFVAQAIPALVSAIQSQDFKGFADAQWDAVVNTADEISKTAQTVGIAAVSAAVTALITAHPDVQAAAATANTTSVGETGTAG